MDGGVIWTAVNTGLTDVLLANGVDPPVVGPLMIDPLAPATVYAATTFGLFKSWDGAATWYHHLREDECFDAVDNDGDGLVDGADAVDCPLSCFMDACPPGYVCNYGGLCELHCANGIQDGDEGDIDCGGSCGAKCQTGRTCWSGWDCQSGICASGVCTVNPPPQFILSLSTVGSGTITASPAPVSGTYAAGRVVSLTATPASGSQFGGWSGACSGTGACSVTMDAAKSVTATFTLKQYALTVSTAGNGSGTVSPSGGTYNHGTVVALTATPASGSQFGGWSGACSGTGACSVTMDAAKSVTATFAALPPLLSLSLNPTTVKGGNKSTGTVTLSGPAPTGGLSVTLSSSSAKIASVPSSITVPAGATSNTFIVSTKRPPSNDTTVTISATGLGVTKEATLTVTR